MTWETIKQGLHQLAQKMRRLGGFVIVIGFLSLVLFSQNALAAGQYSWDGDQLHYDGKVFFKQNTQDANDGKTHYVWRDVLANKAHVISFSSDPKTAKEASYTIYDISGQSFVNPQKTETITASKSNNTDDKNDSAGISSCTLKGIGWIVCPVLKTVSQEVDRIQAVIARYMKIEPISTDKNSALMRVWRTMRDFANLGFVIVFMIMIISYISNVGYSNYDVKKTLPKLAIGVILVNISFYLCVLAVDAVNIIGSSIASLFSNIEAQALGGGQTVRTSWYDFTQTALAGGTLAGAGLTASFAFGGVSGIILTLGSALVGVAITIVTVLAILAARQALVLALVIISPVAFVANLLPNTQTYFQKWLSVSKKMLFLLPVFSLLYGSAQLAGAVIVASAKDVFMLLLGMVVQVVPLIILPKLVKDGDAILDKFGNNFSRFISDPARNKAKGFFDLRRDRERAKWLAGQSNSPLGYLNVPRKLAQVFDESKRRAETDMQSYKNAREAYYLNKRAEAKTGAIYNSKTLESTTGKALEKAKLELSIDSKLQIERLMKAMEEFGLKGGMANLNGMERELAKSALMVRVKTSEEKMANAAQAMHYNKMLQKRLDLGNYRGKRQDIVHASTGIFDGKEGSEVSVISKMIADAKKEYTGEVANYKDAISHYKVQSVDLQKLLMEEGTAIGKDDAGNTFKFDGKQLAVHEAAANAYFPYQIGDLVDFVEQTGSERDATGNIVSKGKMDKYKTQIANVIRNNNIGKSAVFFGSVIPEIIEQGKVTKRTMPAIMLQQLVKGNFGSNDFIGQDKDATKKLTEAIRNFSNISFTGTRTVIDENGVATVHQNVFNDQSHEEIGFGIDLLTKQACLDGMKEYQISLQKALDPKGETYRQLSAKKITAMQNLDKELSAHTGIKALL